MRNSKPSHLHLVLANAALVLALVATPVFASVSKYAGIYSSEAPDTTDAAGPAGPGSSV